MIRSSSAGVKSGRIGTAIMPAVVTAKYDTPQLGMLELRIATLSPAFTPALSNKSCTFSMRSPTSLYETSSPPIIEKAMRLENFSTLCFTIS